MTAPKAAGDSTKSAEIKGKDTRFCPFIGFEDDPETALAYPAPYNFCYHCKPISPVSLSHQRSACLTREFAKCPVYQKETLGPLPKELRGTRLVSHKPKPWLPLVVLILIVLAGLVILSITGLIRIPGLSLPVAGQQATATLTAPEASEITALPSPTPQATETPEPTDTNEVKFATPFAPHAIETPFGENPKLVIHQVQEGEGYILLAEKFGTTAEAIKAINFELPDSLWVNNILVIPINTDDVTALPKFSVREITTEGLTIEDYALRMQYDADILKQYNALPDGYLLKMGDLIVIPN